MLGSWLQGLLRLFGGSSRQRLRAAMPPSIQASDEPYSQCAGFPLVGLGRSDWWLAMMLIHF